jgi:hypothetical protein
MDRAAWRDDDRACLRTDRTPIDLELERSLDHIERVRVVRVIVRIPGLGSRLERVFGHRQVGERREQHGLARAAQPLPRPCVRTSILESFLRRRLSAI